MSKIIKKISHREWKKEGERLFGKDEMKWRFQCPVCKKSQSAEDLIKFTDKGARPQSTYQECLGRFTGGKKGPDKCNWSAHGMFMGPIEVIREYGDALHVFDFERKESHIV